MRTHNLRRTALTGLIGLLGILSSGAAVAGTINTSTFGMLDNGSLDSSPSCATTGTLFIFTESLNPSFLIEGDSLNINVSIGEVCSGNESLQAQFIYAMGESDSSFLTGQGDVILPNAAVVGYSASGLLATTTDNAAVDGIRILNVDRPAINVTGGTNPTIPFQSAILQVELDDPAPLNDPPAAVDDSATTDEDMSVSVDVLSNDTDPNMGDTLTIFAFTQPANGSVTQAGDSLTYTPNSDFNGTDTFTYMATDGSLQSNDATVTITVDPVNDAPVAVDDTGTTNEDEAVTVDVLTNDTDVDTGDTLSISSFTQPANGTVTQAGDDLTYTPNTDFNGTDTFTYFATDGLLTANEATVTITVNSGPDAPVAVDDTATTDEDAAIAVDVLTNDTDADAGAMLTISSFAQPANGTVTQDGDQLTYTPDPNFNGADSFTYIASDGALLSNQATVAVTVNPVNDAPVAVDDATTTAQDTAIVVMVLANDTDPDTGDTLSISEFTQPANGTVTQTGNELTYTPNSGFTDVDTFTYMATDGSLVSNEATVTITVSDVNEAPVAMDDEATTDEDQAVTIDALNNDTDPDGNSISFAEFSQGANGSVSQNGDALVYTPNANFNGADSFTYIATDGSLDSNVATVSITVRPVNDAPVAQDDTRSTPEGQSVGIDVLANDSDIDQDTLSISDFTQPGNGTVTQDGQELTYTPNPGFAGTDNFTYTATDGALNSNAATVTVTVSDVNGPPVAVADTAATDEGVPVDIDVLANDTDPDGDTLSIALFSQPSQGEVFQDGEILVYTPISGFSGTDTFTYVASDGSLESEEATVTVNVMGPDPAPLPTISGFSIDPDEALAGNDVFQSWSTENAVSCSGDWTQETLPTAASGLAYTIPTGTPPGQLDFTITCANADGVEVSDTAEIIILSPPTPAPAINFFDSSPETILRGDTSTLSWDVSDADECSISPAIGLVDPASSSIGVSPEQTTTYELSCSNSVGSDSATTTITVQIPAPVVSLSASSTTVAPGSEITLSWTTENAVSCSLEPGVGDVPTQGDLAVTVSDTSNFTLTCLNSVGVPGSATVSVSVQDVEDTIEDALQPLMDSGSLNPTAAAAVAPVSSSCNSSSEGSQTDSQCDAILTAAQQASEGDLQASREVEQALLQLSGDEVAAVVSSTGEIVATQASNIAARIGELQSGSTGMSVAGLNLRMGNEAISGGQLMSLLQAQETEDDVGGGLYDKRLGLFLNGAIGGGDRNERGGEPGFDFDTYGVTAGVDYRFTDTFFAGVAVGYSNFDVDIDRDGGEVESDGWSLTGYGSSQITDNWYVSGSLGFADNSYDQTRVIDLTFLNDNSEVAFQRLEAESDTDIGQQFINIDSGYTLAQGSWSFTPNVGLQYVRTDIDGYVESGAGENDLMVPDTDFESFQYILGLDVSKVIETEKMIWSPYVSVTARFEDKDDSFVITPQRRIQPGENYIPILVEQRDDSFGRVELGVSWVRQGNLQGFLSYSQIVNYSGLDSWMARVGFRWEF